ncbi:MAG: PAS domain S-box protein [Actinomycetota bacterium]|nr:PAS domain S-box protein [Actinomycetota bacterium]
MNEEHWLLEVVEAMPDGVVIVNDSGEMLLVNREMERLIGYSRDQMLGNTIEMLLPESLRDTHADHRQDYAVAPRRRSMGQGLHLTARRADASTFPVEISLAPAMVAGLRVVIATVRDVTASRLADAELTTARQRVMLAEDHERIARDLHDTVIQRLFAAGLSLQSVLPVVPDTAKVKIERIIDDQDDAIRELRTAIFGLSNKRSAGRTIRVVVNQLVDDASRVLGFRPTLHFNGVLDSIDQEVTDEVAAVVREALSNVARHARANKVEVSLSHVGERLAVVVSDDGNGIPSSHRLGSGLLNMHDRAARLHGTCTVTSGERTGTIVRWHVPVGD